MPKSVSTNGNQVSPEDEIGGKGPKCKQNDQKYAQDHRKCAKSRELEILGKYCKGTVSGSGTGPLDYGATGPVPDTPMRTVSGSGSL